jgi:hypothetical protein
MNKNGGLANRAKPYPEAQIPMRQTTSPNGDTLVAALLALALFAFFLALLYGDLHQIKILLTPGPNLQWQNLRPVLG